MATSTEKMAAVKFELTFLIKECVIHTSSEWKTTSTQITWRRGEREKKFHLPFDNMTVKNECVLQCEELAPQSMFVTLYRNTKGFEPKIYILQLENVVGLSLKRLASYSLNIADYVNMDDTDSLHQTKHFDMKPLSRNIKQVLITLKIKCDIIKTGFEGDSDMDSNFSHISESDDETLSVKDIDVLQARAFQRRTRMFEDLKIAETQTLKRYESIASSPAYFIRPKKVSKELENNKDMMQTLSKLDGNKQVQEIVHQVCDDDFVVRKSLKIKRIELENEALRVQNVHLLSMLGTYKHDVEMMQAEISDLHMLVQNLRMKIGYTPHVTGEDTPPSTREKLHGWLCKRGVKGGPLGHRWRKRWFFHHHDNCLYYSKKKGGVQQRGYIELDKVLGVENVAPHKQDKNDASFNILTEHRTYVLMAHDQETKMRWINALDVICDK